MGPRRDTTPDTTIDLAVLGRVLIDARRTIAAASLAAAVAVGGFAAWRAEPVVVEARILVEPTAIGSPAGDAETRANREDRLVAAQVGLLDSSGLLRHVVEALKDDPSTLDGLPAQGRVDDGLDHGERRSAALHDALTIERIERTRVIALRLATADAVAGRRILTTVYEEYAAGLAEARARAEAEADRRRGREVADARRRLAEARTETTPVPVALDAPVDPELEAARAARAEAEQRLDRLTEFAAAGQSGAEKAVDAGLTGGLRQLREKRGILRSRIAELSIVYLENHPLLKEATERLADLRREMRAEIPRAVAAQKAEIAALDRRIADLATTTTATVPVSPPAASTLDETALAAALAEAVARHDAARAEALGLAAVEARLVGVPDVVETPSPTRPLWAAGIAALLAALLAGLVAGVRGLARPASGVVSSDGEAFDDVETIVPVAVPAVAPTLAPAPPVRAADPEAGPRAALYAEAVAPRIADLWTQIEAEIPSGRRIVVTSVADAARAHAAATLLWAHAAALETPVCRVDLAGTVAEADPALGFTDILAGRVGYSEAIYRDRDHGGWEVPPGVDPLDRAALGDDGVAGILDALATTWGDLVLDVGRLEPGEGLASLLLDADVIVLAEDDRDDPRVLRALDAFLSAGLAVWLLDPRLDADADEAEVADEEAWEIAA